MFPRRFSWKLEHISFLSGETCWKRGVSMWFTTDFLVGNLKFPRGFHIRESLKPERSSFLSKGNLSEMWGFHVLSLMFTLGKLGVSMWFLLCLPWETRSPYSFPLETWGFRVVSPLFPCVKPNVSPWFPCKGIPETGALVVSIRGKPHGIFEFPE